MVPVTQEWGDQPGTDVLLAADSFRVRNARGGPEVRGFALHCERFLRTASTAWLDASPDANPAAVARRIASFLDAARSQLASQGEGFPRFELWDSAPDGRVGHPHLALALRPLPQPLPGPQSSIALRAAPLGPYPLARRKGPNIVRYAALKRELGDEPLLLDPKGRVLEGATTSLIWWDGETNEGAVSALSDRVPSVTESLIREAAHLEPRAITLEELPRCEVWAVNALHGIRRVSHIDGVPCAPSDPERLERFREMLDRRGEPVTAPRAKR